MSRFIERRPAWALITILAVAMLLWLIFSIWPPGALRRRSAASGVPQRHLQRHHARRIVLLVASGFTLIFGLMRNVNLAHGSLYLFGGYIGYAISTWTGSWVLSFVGRIPCRGAVGVLLQVLVFRRMEGQDLRQTMVTIGLSIVFRRPDAVGIRRRLLPGQDASWLIGPIQLPLVTAVKSSGEPVYLLYPLVRLVIFAASLSVIRRCHVARASSHRIGMIVRAGVDDRDILAATVCGFSSFFVLVFALGAGLAGVAGVVGGTFQSISPGEDTRFLLASLVVVIVGGMGSIPGAALGAVIIRSRRATRLGLHPDLRDSS